MLQDLPYFTGEESLQKILFARDNVRSLTGVKVTGLVTKGGELTGVEVTQEGKAPFTISCDGLFVAIGLIPENEAYKDLADLNAWGYFDSDESCVTRTPGIFAAGDCRSKSVRQVVTACADGASAALSAIRYINALSV